MEKQNEILEGIIEKALIGLILWGGYTWGHHQGLKDAKPEIIPYLIDNMVGVQINLKKQNPYYFIQREDGEYMDIKEYFFDEK